ncbi:MAG: Flp family type IVb pilin [Coriobacteriia bacterium]|nr:Flp family type IVb pilin [Coriobacteriia bacterium]
MVTMIVVRALDGLDVDDGATALEYGILVVFIVIVVIVGVTAYGGSLNAFISGLWGRTGL